MANYCVFEHSTNMDIMTMKNRNMLSVVNSRVTNFARLPFSVIRGTEAQRYKKAQEYSDKLAEKLNKISDKKSCSTIDFVKSLKSVLEPHNINFRIKQKAVDNTAANIQRELDYDKEYKILGNSIIEKTDADIVGYNINLKLQNRGMVLTEKANALHEARHLFDYICNPKTIQFRSFKFLYDEQTLANYKQTYDLMVNDYLPFRTMKSMKKEVKLNLSKMSNADGIDTLQSIRRGLKTEKNAYNDCGKFMKQHPLKYLFDILAYGDYVRAMRFDKKLEFVNALLSEKLNAERDVLKQKYSK